MDKLILKKDNLKEFLKSLSGIKLIAPVRENTRTFFREIADVEKAEFDFDDYSATPKKVIFPQTETMFTFRHKDDGLDLEEAEETLETVVFGIRPCDAKSFVILDFVQFPIGSYSLDMSVSDKGGVSAFAATSFQVSVIDKISEVNLWALSAMGRGGD